MPLHLMDLCIKWGLYMESQLNSLCPQNQAQNLITARREVRRTALQKVNLQVNLATAALTHNSFSDNHPVRVDPQEPHNPLGGQLPFPEEVQL